VVVAECCDAANWRVKNLAVLSTKSVLNRNKYARRHRPGRF
jgi:hypothetical protein